jgi:uncharacterized protein YciI
MRFRVGLALFSLAVGVAMSGSAQTPSSSVKITYLVVYRPGPGWISGKPIEQQPLKEHAAYMLSLYERGALRFAGPFLDNAGGAVVLEADNEERAKAMIADDPAVVSRVFVGELHPWRLVDWEQRRKK